MKMKKYLSLLFVLVMCFGILAGCTGTETPIDETPEVQTPEISTPEPEEPEEAEEPDFTAFTTITTEGVLDFPTEFTVLPEAYNTYDTPHKGTTEIIRYTTDVYEDGVTYDKFARVYLPYGYDANDKDKKYNVLYFQHGNQGSPNKLFDFTMSTADANYLLDNMFDPDHQVMEPVIIVCPTYYLEFDENDYKTPNEAPAGDGRFDGIPGNYYKEVVQDLIPAVESQYNVYCEDFSEEGIKATRDHRAWSGYSRGSVCTWYMFHNNIEYFRWFMPMSAECRQEGVPMGTETDDEAAFQYLKETIDAHPGLPFFIFAASGGPTDAVNMRPQMKHFVDQTDTFSYGLDVRNNNFYYTLSEYLHNDPFFPYYLYNARDVLFNVSEEVVVCIGDSITAGSYPSLLEAQLGEKFQVVNLGSPGRTLVDSAQLAYSKTGYLDKAMEMNPDVIIVMLGHGDAIPKNWNAQEYEEQYLKWIRDFQALDSKPDIYLMIPPPTFVVDGKDKVAFDIDPDLLKNDIPDIIRRVAAETGVTVIDQYAPLESHSKYFDDGVHPNEQGNVIIANTVYEVLKKR